MSRRVPITPAVVLALGQALLAADARAIVDEAYRTTLSRPLRYEGQVTVTGGDGARSEKRWLVERKGEPGRGRILVRFLAPAEVKGVALLIVSQPGRSADQWLYTPAIARVRRVAQHSRGSRFYATNLTFEDLEEGDSSASDFEMDGEETIDGDACWRIQARPRRASAYDSRRMWISQTKHVVMRQDLYAGREVTKRVLARGYAREQGVWTPSTVEVLDLKGGGKTSIVLQNAIYDAPLPDNRFTPEALSAVSR